MNKLYTLNGCNILEQLNCKYKNSKINIRKLVTQ